MRRNFNESIAEPMCFAIATDPYGRPQLLLWQPPDAVYSMEYQYKRRAAKPIVAEESTGKIALTASSTTATGTGTAFTSAMVGAVLRVSWDTKPPSGLNGNTPYETEHLIESVTSPTSLELVTAPTASVSNRGFTISSRLDVDEGPMYNLLVRMGMKNLRVMLNINAQNEQVQELERCVKEAKTYDGLRYKGRETANRVIAGGRPGGSYMRTEQ
jgi:hypothetical protein